MDHVHDPHHHLHHHASNHTTSYTPSHGLTGAPPPLPPPPLPPFSFATMAAEPINQISIDPLVFVHDDLLNFALSTQATQSWLAHDTDTFVAMFQPTAPEPVPAMETMDAMPIKYEPPHSPLRINVPGGVPANDPTMATGSLRRSARIAATPRRPVVDYPVTPTTPGGRSSTVGLTSGDDEDDDSDEDLYGRRLGSGKQKAKSRRGGRPVAMNSEEEDEEGNGNSGSDAAIVDKKERRRQQVRAASSRRRIKLKEEQVFLTTRLRELDDDMRTLRVHFPHFPKRH